MRCRLPLRLSEAGRSSLPPLDVRSPGPAASQTMLFRLPAVRANASYGQIVLVLPGVRVSNRSQPDRALDDNAQSRGGEYSDTATRKGRVRPACTVSGSVRPALAKTGTRSPCS